jgi:hypothetical protein
MLWGGERFLENREDRAGRWNLNRENCLVDETNRGLSPVVNAEIRVFGISGGTVRHFVDAPALTVYNVTEPGHIFDPGYVSRSVLLRGDFIYVRTVGEGTGSYRFFNTAVARPAFNYLDRQIRSYVGGP